MIESATSTITKAVPGQVTPVDDRERPLRVMFIITSMPVGGAETLLVDLVRRLDRDRCLPELCCLKEPGPLGEQLSGEVPVHSGLLAGKFDLRILPRLTALLRARAIDAIVTVGAGDKMFWGRLAARKVGVPVIVSALHSTGWPDGIGWLNRRLTSITDAFIAVAPSHGEFLIDKEQLPAGKVRVIPNGVDTRRFAPVPDPQGLRRELNLPLAAPVVTIVAALRPEKNHELFLAAASAVRQRIHDAHFLIVGDGPCRQALESRAGHLGLGSAVRFLGARDDVPAILTASDVFSLTSHNEASPVSILEAMSVGRPVVATQVGSVAETVAHGHTGLLVEPGSAARLSSAWCELLLAPVRRQSMGDEARRRVIERWSVDAMVRGYEELLHSIFSAQRFRPIASSSTPPATRERP